MNKFFITGTKGFIGKRLLEYYNILNTCAQHDIKHDKYGDWINYKDIISYHVKNSDTIFHVGAISSTDASNVNEVMLNNVEYSKFIFDEAEKYQKPVIFSSSASIYGSGNGVPKNLYAWSKKVSEDYGLRTKNKVIALRYFNVYGPGECHKGKMASVVNQAFHHANHSKAPFKLLPKKPLRDFIHVNDVVLANVHAFSNIEKIESGAYDIGTCDPHSFEDCLDVFGIKYQYLPETTIPDWYQFNTRAEEGKLLPGWKVEESFSERMKSYKRYLENTYIWI